MKIFFVKVIKAGRKITYEVTAADWYEAWLAYVNIHGDAGSISVKAA